MAPSIIVSQGKQMGFQLFNYGLQMKREIVICCLIVTLLSQEKLQLLFSHQLNISTITKEVVKMRQRGQ